MLPLDLLSTPYLQEQAKFDEVAFLLQGSQEQEEKEQHSRHTQVGQNIGLQSLTNLGQRFSNKHYISLVFVVVENFTTPM